LDSQTDELSDKTICERIHALNELSNFKFACNSTTIAAIRSFLSRKSFISIVLGRSKIYFDMYEEYFDKYDLPKELKYLSVIESALNPKIRSRSGAVGLWQFMYGTGKLYGLNSNSYMDERMDPRKETIAACRYLKTLYKIYADWNLALAAYNAGPGTINRAIRRAGGSSKPSYWKIRPYLPRETQQYVPRFIAATYAFTYAKKFHITAAPNNYTYYQLDTMCLKKGVQMADIERLIGWKTDSIKYFNPVYRGTYIPNTTPDQCITGPISYIGKLVSAEDSLYQLADKENVILENDLSKENQTETLPSDVAYDEYKVSPGETLEDVAEKLNISTTLLAQENKLKDENATITAGQKLKIPKVATDSLVENKNLKIVSDTVYTDTIMFQTHIVQRNENLSIIAQNYHVSKDSIMVWNHLRDSWINIGQKLKIRAKKQVIDQIIQRTVPTEQAKTTVAPKPTPTVTRRYHTVRSGETMNRIAVRYHVSLSHLRRLNPHVNPSRIRPGQKIRIR